MALGKAPSKDTLWTSDNGDQATTRGGCDKKGCPPDHSSPAAELHTMLALLSTGPVGFSDAPNETDAALIKRTCDSVGNLLQPSRPITSVDSSLAADASAAPSGYVLSTHTAVSGRVWAWFVLAHQLKAPFTARVRDVWPAPPVPLTLGLASDVRALRACARGSQAAACGLSQVALPAGSTSPATPLLTLPAVPAGRDVFTPVLALLAPLCPTSAGAAAGTSVFGEVEKVAPISVQRFLEMGCGEGGVVSFTISGQPGEAVGVKWVDWSDAGTGVVGAGTFTFPAGGKGAMQAACTVAGGSLSCTPSSAGVRVSLP
jgi:hypothetical protein